MTDIAELRSVAQRWLQAEPDADMRAELDALLAGPEDVLVERFTGRLNSAPRACVPPSVQGHSG